MTAHALLSASGAHKWLHCTPSARLEATLPESTSDYAEEGRLAHEIAELKLRKQFTEPMGATKFKNALKKLQEKPLYKEEMLQHTDSYKDYICSITHGFATVPYVAVEKKLDFSSYVPEGFGTGDCIVINGDTLYVVDFKYGKGVPVSAQENPQMMLYALGAYISYAILYPLTKVKVIIFQPRLGEPSEWELSVKDLLTWGDSIKPMAQKAFAGEGDFKPGDHCRFCRAKAQCRARAELNQAVMTNYPLKPKPPIISNDEVGQILASAQDFVKWVTALEEYALGEVLKGNEIPGWKAVEGRGSRGYVNIDVAFSALTANGIDEAMLYERKPLTVPNVEKLLGKAKYKELLLDAGHVKSEPGKPTLAPISDKREAITRISAADDFKAMGGIVNE